MQIVTVAADIDAAVSRTLDVVALRAEVRVVAAAAAAAAAAAIACA